MTKVKLFKTIESELISLENEINQWVAKSKVKILSVTGNIAPQTGRPAAAGAFSSSDVLVVVLYEDSNG